MANDTVNPKLKALENLLLLLLGADTNRLSVLHIQKEMFILWNFHPAIKDYLDFIKHYRGPFSTDIEKMIHHPFYLDSCWTYESSTKNDDLSGGYVELTAKGIQEYNRIYEEARKKGSLQTLLTGIKMVRELYDKLSLEELLLLIYDTYPEYTEKSNVLQRINSKKAIIAKRLLIKGLIDEERYRSLVVGDIFA